MPQHQSTPQTQSPQATAAPQNHSLQHGAIGIAAVAACAQQIKPKDSKQQNHPLPPCLRDQD